MNRNGIPIFDGDQNLNRLFLQHTCEDTKENDGEQVAPDTVEMAPSKQVLRDRHGLPFLDKDQHLYRLFNVSEQGKQADETAEGEAFPELLESSLKGKSRDALLREKRDREPPRPVPLKKRLKRYPPPRISWISMGSPPWKQPFVRKPTFATPGEMDFSRCGSWWDGDFTLKPVQCCPM